ncbi:MAG TPA: hypothetical protein VL528_05035 [Oxalicibacterium sp.]|jgi:hypothetical protein|nr:hypothetical protein [Oxalicibacterium sp.]
MAVDNFVDKRLLTLRQPSRDAGFDKLLKTKAKINPFIINDLFPAIFLVAKHSKLFTAHIQITIL